MPTAAGHSRSGNPSIATDVTMTPASSASRAGPFQSVRVSFSSRMRITISRPLGEGCDTLRVPAEQFKLIRTDDTAAVNGHFVGGGLSEPLPGRRTNRSEPQSLLQSKRVGDVLFRRRIACVGDEIFVARKGDARAVGVSAAPGRG